MVTPPVCFLCTHGSSLARAFSHPRGGGFPKLLFVGEGELIWALRALSSFRSFSKEELVGSLENFGGAMVAWNGDEMDVTRARFRFVD